ncbi:MAG: 4-phosphoerythronate dehydrogenase [Bacteroidales bacterium]|nr:4-phosphoerythronate dehydrogenase [Bacteroidales bacterium]
MKFVIDQAIPFIRKVFEPYAEIVYKEGSEITHEDLMDADALIIRTRTRCNEALLAGTSVKIISTAAIGMDHIDLSFCDENGIFVQNAAGCNAGGVMNYVFSALYGAASRERIPLTGATFGIIGVGNVGSRIEQMARHLGMTVLLCDPPRAEVEGPGQFVSLDTLLQSADIVSLSVPLNAGTQKMVNDDFFAKMKFGAIFINTARGEIVDDDALKRAFSRLGPVIIDTWNNEPDVDRELIEKATIATPHIAGYSYQGKQRATAAAVRSVARFFKIEPLYEFFPTTELEELEAVKLDLTGLNQGQITSVFQYNYPIFTDDFMFRVNPDQFDELRQLYRYRREFYI